MNPNDSLHRDPNNAYPSPETLSRIDRRLVVKGAAWSVPVILAAQAMPSASASVVRRTYTFTVAGTGTASASCKFTLPATAENITYTVIGGAGGYAVRTDYLHGGYSQQFAPGGYGAKLTGTLNPPAVDTDITITAAGRGANGSIPNGSTIAGGAGWGAGGGVANINNTSLHYYVGGGAGGGASALLVDGEVAVVAGGGGGGGSIDSNGNFQWVGSSPNLNYVYGGNAASTLTGSGSAGTAASSWRMLNYTTPSDPRITTYGGSGGTAAAGGAGGTATASGSTTSTLVGNAGTVSTAVAGGKGGAGKAISVPSFHGYSLGISSGGGGGGFTGGGSGALGTLSFHAAPGPTGNTETGIGCNAGGGGGGTNKFLSSVGGITLVHGSVGVNTALAPGSVIVSFTAPDGLDLSTCGSKV